MNKFIVYTDGSSRGNPGPGGWGAIIFSEDRVFEMAGKDANTTNNKMEMTAAIEALKNTPDSSEVEIHTDSEYLMKGATLWINNWQKNNWRTKDKREVLNRDLWEELLIETEKRKVGWQKVVGHSGHRLNDRCDELATSFADGKIIELYNGPKSNYQFHS